jgi:putative peptide zinc metalloprotease protein
MIHELAHAVVARSLGAPARVAVGNLMYTLVAQTDISAIWLAPKRMRYLAFLSGTIVDLVLASLLVDLLWAGDHGWITLQPTVVRPLLGALLFTFVGRILFQFLFYLRTDIYYVLATAMHCRNLMSDTETLLRNVFFRLVRRPDRVVDQSGIPRRERRHIREYAGFYAIGRVFWLLVLIYFYLPLLWNYLEQFVLVALGRPHRFGLVDFLVAFTVVVLINGGGIYLWIRSLHRSWRRHRARAGRPVPTGGS